MKKRISILLIVTLLSGCTAATRPQMVQRTITTAQQTENGSVVTETVEVAPSTMETTNTILRGIAAAGFLTLGIAAALGKIH